MNRIPRGHLKKDKLILYLAVGVIFLLYWIHGDPINKPGNFAISILNNLWQVIYVVGINLLYFEYVLPSITSRKSRRPLLIISSIIVHLMVFMVGLYGWRSLGTLIDIYHPFTRYTTTGQLIFSIVSFTPGAFILFAVFKLFFDYTQLKYEGQQARLEKKQAELLFLKGQINPHFLFNTLNNIYSLSQYQPQLVSESVLRLSKILRYMLYETGSEFITVDKEIKIIDDYIDLEKLRYNETVVIEFDHDIEDPSETMPPLLLLPLIENAFKHGVSQSRGNRFIRVMFSLKKGQLLFTVINSSDRNAGNQEIKENIGLSNLRRRLNLLYREFNLDIGQKDSTFTVTLTINLASHV